MRCVSPSCAETIADGARFCPFCRVEQKHDVPVKAWVCGACQEENPASVPSCWRCGQKMGASVSSPLAPGKTPSAVQAVRPRQGTAGDLILRASDQIWQFEEAEGPVVPGRRRPLLILDEQVVHLAHTDNRLEPHMLAQRVQALLEAQCVPVVLEQAQVRWLRDAREARPRLVASLRDHPNSDIKLIFGVDYMGTWASIQMHLGVEPDPVSAPPSWSLPVDAIIALVLGIFTIMFVIGIFGIIYAAWRGWTSYKKHQETTAAQQSEAETRRARQRLSRSYKVDDMRLFCSAMRAVFQAVVDDIVCQGGEVTRIDGGRGGFFEAHGVALPAETPRRSDAAHAGV